MLFFFFSALSLFVFFVYIFFAFFLSLAACTCSSLLFVRLYSVLVRFFVSSFVFCSPLTLVLFLCFIRLYIVLVCFFCSFVFYSYPSLLFIRSRFFFFSFACRLYLPFSFVRSFVFCSCPFFCFFVCLLLCLFLLFIRSRFFFLFRLSLTLTLFLFIYSCLIGFCKANFVNSPFLVFAIIIELNAAFCRLSFCPRLIVFAAQKLFFN